MKFDYCISNPPYQMQIGRSQWIYTKFIEAGNEIARRSSYITPSGFMTTFDTTQGINIKLRLSPSLVKVCFYEVDTIFPGIGVNGVAISVFDKSYNNKGRYEHQVDGVSEFREILQNPEQRLPIPVRKITEKLASYPGVGSLVSSRNPWIKESYEHQNQSMWKAAFKEKNVTAVNASKVLAPGEKLDHRYLAAYFATKNEAENFLAYQRSKFYQYLVQANTTSHAGSAKIHNICPDLNDYTTDNPLFCEDANLPQGHAYHGLSLDERLYRFFKLDEDDVIAIEQQ